jgi:hypothetical protein
MQQICHRQLVCCNSFAAVHSRGRRKKNSKNNDLRCWRVHVIHASSSRYQPTTWICYFVSHVGAAFRSGRHQTATCEPPYTKYHSYSDTRSCTASSSSSSTYTACKSSHGQSVMDGDNQIFLSPPTWSSKVAATHAAPDAWFAQLPRGKQQPLRLGEKTRAASQSACILSTLTRALCNDWIEYSCLEFSAALDRDVPRARQI